MSGFFSLNGSNTSEVSDSHEGRRSMRGRGSGVVAAGAGVLAPNDAIWELSRKIHSGGSLVDLQSLGKNHPSENVLEPQFKLTDEPLPFIHTSTRSAWKRGQNNRRGRLFAVAATSPTRAVQEPTLQQSEPLDTETLTPSGPLRPPSITTTQDIQENPVALDISLEKASKKELTQVPSRRDFPKDPSIVGQIDRFYRFPLRTGTDPTSIASPITDGERSQHLRTPSLDENKCGLAHLFAPPLQWTLYDSSHKLTSAPPLLSAQPTLLLLVVGVAYGGLKDPQHDLDILKTLFNGQDSDKVHFKSISGKDATLEAIEEALGEFYREALKVSGSNLLILLTGEGDGQNRMHLMGSNVLITDQDLRRWMWKLQIDCHPNNRTVTIILDYCRTNPGIPIGAPHVGVEFIWSCSPGQFATGLRFPNTHNIPRSCFLLAFMMASYSTRNQGDLDPILAINYELRRLLRFLELFHKKAHETGQCGPCYKGEPCTMPPPSPQDPDWQQSGSMKPVHDMVNVLSKMDIVSEVHRRFMSHSMFREANGLSFEGDHFEPASSHQTSMKRHSRGSSKPVHAALIGPRES